MVEPMAIGIDLGTTFSGAAIYRKGRSEMIPNLQGDYLTPSFIFYSPISLDVAVGSSAYHKSLSKVENYLYDMKRIIGRKYDDAYVQKMIQSQNFKYYIVSGEDEKAEIKLMHDRVVVTKSPEQACSEILRYLKTSAEKFLGFKVSEAVISVPAYFSNAQRKSTKAAAELAELKVLKLVTEPVAAAIHYTFDKIDHKSTLLVFDWGGGTLDVSIIKADKKTFEVKSVEGDTSLGGRDFDEILVDHFKTDMVKKFGNKIIQTKLTRRLLEFCKIIKIGLSTNDEYAITMDYIEDCENQEYTLSLTRKIFEKLTDDLFKRALSVVDLALKNSDLLKTHINNVILVGGTSRIPKIQEMLTTYFTNEKIKADLNPDEAVALGAALQAAVIKQKCEELEKYKITEVTPFSLGLGLSNNLMCVFLKKNTTLPSKAEHSVQTVANFQTQVKFTIYEGERKNCKFNNTLGTFCITNLQRKRAGDVQFKVTFHLNEDGILTVTATENETEQTKKLMVTIGEFRFCENEIQKVLFDAERTRVQDEKFEKFVYYLWPREKQCHHILYELDNLPIEHRSFVAQKCKHFLNVCDTFEYERFEEFKKEYELFITSVKPKIKNFIKVDLEDFNDTSSETKKLSLAFNNLALALVGKSK